MSAWYASIQQQLDKCNSSGSFTIAQINRTEDLSPNMEEVGCLDKQKAYTMPALTYR